MNRSTISCVYGRIFSFKSLNLKYLAILVLAMLTLPFLAYGQNATIVGTVTDPSGAVVPNATITITHVETGRATVLKSNDAGEYVASDIPIGHYNVKAAATGFKLDERLGIVLQEHDRARVDFQLQLGTTAQSVSVEANPIAVQADTGEISNVINGTQVLQSDGVGFHGNRLRRGANLQLEVNANAIVFLQHDPEAFRYLESGSCCFHVVAADGNIGSHVFPRIIRCEDSGTASIHMGNRYCGVGNHRTRRVGNGANDGSVLPIGQERQA